MPRAVAQSGCRPRRFRTGCRSVIGLYWERLALSPVQQRSIAMTKERSSKKEAKKQPVLSPKEKKAAKQVKKHASDNLPLMTPR